MLGQMEGRKDRQTLFYRTLLAVARGLTSTTAVDWHLKVKSIEYDVGLTINYCIIVSIQKISSIYKLILKIKQVLASHELNGYTHFWPSPPKKPLGQLLAFPNLDQDANNQLIPSIHYWDTVNFRVLWTDCPHSFLTMLQPKKFDELSLYQHAKNQTISLICSGDMVD